MGLAVTSKQTALFAFPVFLLATFFSNKNLTYKQRLLNSGCFVFGLAVILGAYTALLNELLENWLGWLTAKTKAGAGILVIFFWPNIRA